MVLIDVLAEMVTAVGAPLLVNVAVLSGTVGVELQLVPVVHSAPGPCQVPSVACADVAASKAAAAVVANKYARISPPPCGDVSTQTGFLLQDCRPSALEAILLEAGSADLLQPVALRPRMRDQFRPRDEVLRCLPWLRRMSPLLTLWTAPPPS